MGVAGAWELTAGERRLPLSGGRLVDYDAFRARAREEP